MYNKINRIIGNYRPLSSEEIREEIERKEYAKFEMMKGISIIKDMKERLIKRNPKGKFEKEHPGANYDRFIEEKYLKKYILIEQRKEVFRQREKEEEKRRRSIRKNRRGKNLKKIFGKTVQRLRKKKGLSKEYFSKKPGLNRSYFSEIEDGKHNISLKEIGIIANKLNLYVYELLEFSLKNIENRTSPIENGNLQKSLGMKIKQLRKNKNMTQEQLGLKSTLNRVYIARIEKGEINISLENIGRIANTLELHISSLLKFN